MNIYKQVLVIIFNLFAVSLIYGYGVSKNEILILKDAQVVYLGESIQELYNSHGQPLKTTIDSFISNSDWDSICLEYNDFNVSYFKITQKLRQIETKGNHFKIKLQKVTLYAGMDLYSEYKDRIHELNYQVVLDELEKRDTIGHSRLLHKCFDTSEHGVTYL